MENVNDFFGKLTDFLKTEVKTETIIGQQFQLGAFTCVPVMSVGIGFGSGGGEGKDAKNGSDEGKGFGGGAGIGLAPIGFLVANGNDIQFISTKSSKGMNALFEKAPDLIEKMMEKKKEEKEQAGK